MSKETTAKKPLEMILDNSSARMVALFVVVFIACSLLQGKNFLSPDNFLAMFRQFPEYGLLAIGIGMACLMYFLNIVANISSSARPLKYISSFSYTETADIIESGHLEVKYLLLGMIFMIAGIIIAYIRYEKKDLR